MAGTLLQNSLKGFLASMLSQIVTKSAYSPNSNHIPAIQQRHNLADWSSSELLRCLEEVLSSLSSYVCLVVDGLDEFDQRHDFDELYDITKVSLRHVFCYVWKIASMSSQAYMTRTYLGECSRSLGRIYRFCRRSCSMTHGSPFVHRSLIWY